MKQIEFTPDLPLALGCEVRELTDGVAGIGTLLLAPFIGVGKKLVTKTFASTAMVLTSWLLPIISASVAEAQEPSGLAAAIALEKAMVSAIERCDKSVVAIARDRKGLGDRMLDPEFIPTEFATGVVVSRDGLILTTDHALGDRERNDYVVWIDGRGHRATIKATDTTYDLAVLKIEVDSLTPMPMGDAKDLKKGQIVIALGNPLAIARDGSASATWGIVSNLHRKAAPRPDAEAGVEQKDTLHHYGTLIQTDARLERGTSGGALVNLQGEMVGLTSTVAALPGSEEAAGFAIPVSDTFRRVVQQLKLGEKVTYGFLGVAPDDSFFAQRDGVRIVNVVPGTPAAAAGIRVGDTIMRVGDTPLTNAGDLILSVSQYPAGQTVPVHLVRTGERFPTIREVTLSKKYIRSARESIATTPPQRWRGMTVDYTTAHPRFVELSLDADPGGCVVVTDVVAESPAWKAGLRSGLFISHIAREQIASPEDFYRIAEQKSGNVRLRLASRLDRLDPIVVADD